MVLQAAAWFHQAEYPLSWTGWQQVLQTEAALPGSKTRLREAHQHTACLWQAVLERSKEGNNTFQGACDRSVAGALGFP